MQNQAVSRRQALARAGAVAGLAALPPNLAGATERLAITRIDLFRVAVPMQDDIIHSPEIVEEDFAMVPKFILKVYTDSGIVGIGETVRGEDGARLRRNAESLRGRNILDLNLTRLELPTAAGYAAFEMAFYESWARPSAGRSTSCWADWPSARCWWATGAAARTPQTCAAWPSAPWPASSPPSK